MKVVVNATPLIALSLVGQLDLLRRLFDEVLTAPAVYHEVVTQGGDHPGAAALAAAHWVQVQAPMSVPTIEPLLLGLDLGELQVLLLAREVNPNWVLIDERLGRRTAQAMHLPVKGTMGLLLAAVHAGFVTRMTALEALQRLLDAGIRLSPAVVTWFQSELDTG